MLVILDGLVDQLLAEPHLLLHLDDKFCVDVEFFGVEGEVVDLGLVELVEGVTPQPVDVDAMVGVGHEDLREDVLRLRRKEFG